MLAIKLHESRRPFLGVGSHLMPFIGTAQGRDVLHCWANVLINYDRMVKRNCNVSLVKIPDDVFVVLSPDYFASRLNGLHPKAPEFRQTLQAMAKPLSAWSKNYLNEMVHVPEFPDVPMNFRHSLAELLLAEPLSCTVVKWTKRFRLWRKRR